MTDAQDAAVAKGHVYPRLDPGLEDRIAAYIQDRDRSREQSLVAAGGMEDFLATLIQRRGWGRFVNSKNASKKS